MQDCQAYNFLLGANTPPSAPFNPVFVETLVLALHVFLVALGQTPVLRSLEIILW